MKIPTNQSSNQKVIIFDSSSIINLTMNGLLYEFRELKKIFNGKFIVTKDVQREIIDKPLEIKRFKLEALKIKELFDEKVLENPASLGIDENKLSKLTEELKNVANNAFVGNRNAIHIVDSGEVSCLALSRLLTEKGIKNILSVDERTLRMICEKPENLLEILRRKLHTEIKMANKNFSSFRGFNFIRSAELVFVAYKKGIIKLKNHSNVLDALLYALKFNGCSISDEEISEMEKLV